MKKEINPFVPGAVILKNGDISVMNDGYHDKFFQKIIIDEYKKLGMDVPLIKEENNLMILCSILLYDFGILPYVGCTSGDRKYTTGFLFVPSLEKLEDKQLSTIIDLYSEISSQYIMSIIEVPNTRDNNFETSSFQTEGEREISIGEIYEEMVKRSDKIL